MVATCYDVVYKRWWLETTKSDTNFNDSGVHGSNNTAPFGSEKSVFSEHKPIFDPEMQKPKLYSDNKAGRIQCPAFLYKVVNCCPFEEKKKTHCFMTISSKISKERAYLAII